MVSYLWSFCSIFVLISYLSFLIYCFRVLFYLLITPFSLFSYCFYSIRSFNCFSKSMLRVLIYCNYWFSPCEIRFILILFSGNRWAKYEMISFLFCWMLLSYSECFFNWSSKNLSNNTISLYGCNSSSAYRNTSMILTRYCFIDS